MTQISGPSGGAPDGPIKSTPVGGGDFGADLTLDLITSGIARSVIEPSPARQTGSDARAEIGAKS